MSFIGTFPAIEQKLIWSIKHELGWGWRKAVVELPNDLDEYKLLLEGVYGSFQPPPSYPRNHVTIDNLELKRCSVKGKSIHLSFVIISMNVCQMNSHTN